MRKLDIASSEEWQQMLKDMQEILYDYATTVMAKARGANDRELGIAVGKHDGFVEAITYLKGLGGK